ncbi:hypothetical protein CVD28_00335 [Bacillus sp. M6-12]|uniref:GNAT family N-acetyltransferase n=1 Tax=Bacillus sp. M6-12 TaxID=2054166 RepID=UPI000C76D827|nr:GNAT family N-acetyltransferase [Bacillus sp. M6-12]PLS18883.1 hypothetical protein CVD28_00335 [Bacillus sp. M6-12]
MLKPNDFEHIKKMIENKDKVKLRVDAGFGKKSITYIGGLGNVVFQLKEDNEENVSIHHMSFKNERKGLGTAVLEELIQYLAKNNKRKLFVENVTTRAMVEFCKKNGFKPVERQVYIKDDGCLYGNYQLTIETEEVL